MTTEWHQDGVLAIDHAGPAAFACRFRGLIAYLLFAVSLPVFADDEDCASARRTCEQNSLQREERYNYQLAVCQESGWHFYEHSRTSTLYKLAVPSNEVELFWAVPASKHHEFIYASTFYSHRQRLSISRSPIYEVPGMFRVLAPLKKVKEVFSDEPKSTRESFLHYHDRKDRLTKDDPVFKSLAKWHDTEFWGLLKSYDLVHTALAWRKERREGPLVAAERLIRLAKDRPKTSWIDFCGRVEEGKTLHVSLAYSGYRDRVWPFNFKVSWDVQVTDENEQ